MRRNSDRVSPELNDDITSQLAAAQKIVDRDIRNESVSQQNVNFPLQTEMVKIPSGGKYYPEDHPLCDEEFVEIKYMTAKDEDILTSKSLLKQGIAIDRFLENVVLNKKIKAKDLLTGDKNAILVAARVTGFGPEYSTRVTCPNCSSITQHSFDLSELENKEEPDWDVLGVDRTEEGTFLVTLPRTGYEVELRLLTGKDEAEMLLSLEKREKKGLPSSSATTQLSYIIKSINGNSNRSEIHRVVETLPSFDSRYIRDIYTQIIPNLDMTQEFNCSKCGYDQEVSIPVTVDFFWSK